MKDVARLTIDSGLELHKQLELETWGVTVKRQTALPVVYDTIRLDAGYRRKLPEALKAVVDIKAVDLLTSLHEAQILTCLKPSGYPDGFLRKFNVALFRQGSRRCAQ